MQKNSYVLSRRFSLGSLALLTAIIGGLALSGCGGKSEDKSAVGPQPGSAAPSGSSAATTPNGQPPLAHDTAQTEAIIKEAKEGKNE